PGCVLEARATLRARPDDPWDNGLETIHFGPEYCGRALSLEGGERGDRNGRTGDETSDRRERSETTDGRRKPGDGKGSGRRHEDSPQGRGGHNRDGSYFALERVLVLCVARQASARVPAGDMGWPTGRNGECVSAERAMAKIMHGPQRIISEEIGICYRR